jgi:hypothetical protein
MDVYALRTTRSGAQNTPSMGPVPFQLTLYNRDDDWTISGIITQSGDDIAMLQCVQHSQSAACVCVGPLIQTILVCQLKGAPRLDILARLVQLVGVAGRQSTLQLHQNLGYVHILGGWRLLTLSMLSLRQTDRPLSLAELVNLNKTRGLSSTYEPCSFLLIFKINRFNLVQLSLVKRFKWDWAD